MPGQPKHGGIAARHERYVRQAGWTQATRSHLYRRAGLLRARRVLDVGCGTGAITQELARRCQGEVIGLDVDPEAVDRAREHGGEAHYQTGRAEALPFPDRHFDLVHCHFLLMWIADPVRALRDMARVVCPDGAILICAEPDYGGRLDWPDLPVGQWQIEGLRRQGADPTIGRRLRHLAVEAGLRAQIGMIPSLWDEDDLRANFESEWAWLWRDTAGAVSSADFDWARERAWAAIEQGTRQVFMPIFYAFARPM